MANSLNSQKTVIVGMSGGVDSSVTAALLREQGYRVIGLFMKNWEEKDENGVCTSTRDYEDVVKVCNRLDIPYYTVNFVKEYWDGVFTNFVKDYQAGLTPNPDILCNREIKFKVFFQKAMDLGGDYLATGHYCQNVLSNWGNNQLTKGADPGKDQTYFLYTIGKETLKKVLFPVGALQKSEVREIAVKYQLSTQAKKDSTGICFIGERNFPKFLGQYVAAKPGRFQTLDGSVVGEHQGMAFYTLGQRKHLGLGGEGEPWFVVAKNPDKNIVYVERGTTHPSLYCDQVTATDLTWVSGQPPILPFRCRAKLRYRQKDQDCVITKITSDGRLTVRFDIPQRAVTPGQSAVFYSGAICLGGGIIAATGPSYHERAEALPEVVSH